MKLESIALWEEKELFFDRAMESPVYGSCGSFRGRFADTGTLQFSFEQAGDEYNRDAEQRFSTLCRFLMSDDGAYLFRSQKDMECYCSGHLHDHVFYPFNRECWGFRVLDEDYAWYITCTPWNSGRPVSVYCYDRKMLMTELARRRGLPEQCWGILPYTGERIRVRFGGDQYELFPQYGGNAADNRTFAKEQNAPLGIPDAQVAAMVNGVIYGWESPMANVQNYDGEGHYVPPVL